MARRSAPSGGTPPIAEVRTRLRDDELFLAVEYRLPITETARRRGGARGRGRSSTTVDVEAIERAHAKITAHARKLAEKERAALLEAIQGVRDARLRLAEAVGLEQWAARVAEQGHGHWRPERYVSRPPGLLTPAGDSFPVSEVLDALRALAEPLAPRPSSDQRSWPKAA